MGTGSGEGNMPFSLPDIIQKQGDINEKMKSMMQENKEGNEMNEGKENGKQDSGNDKNGENQSKKLYEIYKEQSKLREALERQLEDINPDMQKAGENIMEQLEKILLEKGFTNEVLQKMQKMEHELLKLKNATYDQGLEEKRRSKSVLENTNNTPPTQLQEFYKRLNNNELLNREPIPFTPNINQRVIKFFNQNAKDNDQI